MKSLHDYILQEKLHLNRNIKMTDKTIELKIPKADRDDEKIYDDTIWKTINMPDAKFVIVKDAYRRNLPHFMVMGDFLMQLLMFQDDYEDFTPDKTILYASNDLNDAIKWYCKYLKIDNSVFSIRDYGELYSELENTDEINYRKTCDSLEFFARLITSDKSEKWNDEDLELGCEGVTFDNYVDYARDLI